VPVSLVTWSIGRIAGGILAALSAAGWLAADLLSGHGYSYWAIPYWNAVVRFGLFVLAVFGLAALKQALVYARTDALTGLPNSRAFHDAAERELDRARRYARPLTLAYLDIDGFKQVNDSLGHERGDDVLKTVASALRQSLRRSDVAARLGGDEFGILLPETDPVAARRVLEKVHAALVDCVADIPPKIGFSIGGATWVVPPASLSSALRKADELMYAAKRRQGQQPIQHEALSA
jgi:diguanylate cyclase (GGDEF)-like protein